MRHIYVTNCDENGGICHYILENGELNYRETLKLDRAMYTVISENRFFVLLRDLEKGDGFGGVVEGEIDSEGRMKLTSTPLSSHGVVPCHLCVMENDIYIANYLSGNLVKIPEKIVTHSGKGPHPIRQTEPHTHFVCASPDEKYILNTDLGVDTVFVYDRELNEVSSSKVPVGSGCRHLEFSEKGDFVYCVNELSNDVSVFSFKEGQLGYIKTYSAIPEFKEKSTAAAIRLYKGHLYISHRGADCITAFKAQGEKLTFVANTPCGGERPRDFNIADDYIICANEGGSVTVMKIENGVPHFTKSYPLAGDPLGVNVY